MSVATPAAERWKLATFRALRHRNYRLYFWGQLISLTGSWMQNAAMSWLAYDLTGQSAWTGRVNAALLLPTLLFGAWGGSLADRYPKLPIIFVAQSTLLVLALLLSVLSYLGLVTVWHLVAIAVAAGIVTAIDLPARLAFVIDMVGRDDLGNAIALNSLVFNLARAGGPVLGTLALAYQGPALCFLLNGVSYVAVLIALARMDVVGQPASRVLRPFSPSEGYRFFLTHPRLLLLLGMTAAMALFGWPTLALLPALAREHLRGGESIYGTLLGGVGCGALVAALLVASFGSKTRARFFLAAGAMLAVVALLWMSQVRSFVPAIGSCTLLGLGLILYFPTGQSVMQLGAGNDNRGLIMGIWSMVLTGATPLGNILAGAAADRWGVDTVLATQGLGLLCALVGVIVLQSLLRPVPRPTD